MTWIVLMVDGPVAESFKINLTARRIIAVDRMSDFIEIEAHQHRTEAETMIAMKMADKNSRGTGRRNIRKDKLPLSPFTRIK